MVWPSPPLLISLVVTCGLWRRKHASAAVICIMPALYRFLYARFRRHIVVAQRYAARHNPHVALVISTLALRYQFILLSLFSVNDRFSSQTPPWQVLLNPNRYSYLKISTSRFHPQCQHHGSADDVTIKVSPTNHCQYHDTSTRCSAL